MTKEPTSNEQATNKQKIKKEILEIFNEWATSTTAHGPGNIARSGNLVVKVLWMLCLMGSIGYCTYQVVMTIIQYSQNEVVTTSKIIYEAPTKFPAIVICNLNPYDGDVARKDMDYILNNEKITKDFEPIDYVDKASDYFKSEFETRDPIDTYYYGFYLDQMLISCRFRGKPCTENDFETFHDYHYGNCYRFNSGSNNTAIKEIKKPGWKNGLRLELYIGDLSEQQQYIYKAGMRVIIHNQSVTPFPDEDGIDVSVGTQTNIKITRTFISRLSSPYSNCVSDYTSKDNLKKNELFQYINKFYTMKEYNQKYCQKICLQRYIISKCGCYDFELPRPNDNTTFNACTTVENIDCAESADNDFFDGNESQECNFKCPIECDQVVYNLKSSTARYPSKWYADVLREYEVYNYTVKNQSFTELQQTLLMININYDDMYYNEVTQSPAMTIEQLIAFVGGNFGLFVGISLLSIIEMIEIVFYLFWLFIQRKNVFACRKKKYAKESKELPTYSSRI